MPVMSRDRRSKSKAAVPPKRVAPAPKPPEDDARTDPELPMPNRRRSTRLPVNEELLVIAADVVEWVSDVSHTGAFLSTRVLVPIGARIQMRFTLFTDELDPIEGEAEVVRHGTDERPGLGVRFLALTRYSRAALERLLGPQT